jgi:hypothetical protein
MLLRYLPLFAGMFCITSCINASASEYQVSPHALKQKTQAKTKKYREFADCLTLKEAIIPGSSTVTWSPFCVWRKTVEHKQVEGKAATQHLAPDDGVYASWNIQTCVGFVGSADADIAHELAKTLQNDDIMLWWREYFNDNRTATAVLQTVISIHQACDGRFRRPKSPILLITGSKELTEDIIAPDIIHTAFAAKRLEPLDTDHVELMACYAQHRSEAHQRVPYYVVDHAVLHKLHKQEQIGKRIIKKHSGS